MSDIREQNLRDALIDLAASRSTDADSRLCSRDYHPRTTRARWPAAGMAGTVIAAVAATVVVLLSSAAPRAFAYAGWSSLPTTPTRSAVAAATVWCNAMIGAGKRLTGNPVLSEARGKYTAAVYTNPSAGWYDVCLSDGTATGTAVGSGHGIFALAAPGPDQLGLPAGGESTAPGFPGTVSDYRGKTPAWWSALASSTGAGKSIVPQSKESLQATSDMGIEHYLVGLAGQNVRSVRLLFEQGVTVDATVRRGWYFAWWPGAALPARIAVTRNTGARTTSPDPVTVGWEQACSTGYQQTGSCGVFATGLRQVTTSADH